MLRNHLLERALFQQHQSTPNVHKIAQNEMSPVKIPMEIKVQDKLVCFDYLLKSDTPDFVSRECVRDFKFDQKYYDIIKDKITNVLDFYQTCRKKFHEKEKVKKN